MLRTNIYLESRQAEELDRRAGEEGVSRAELVRRLLDRSLGGGGDDTSDDLATIEAAFGVIGDQEIEALDLDLDLGGRGPGEREAHLARVWGAA